MSSPLAYAKIRSVKSPKYPGETDEDYRTRMLKERQILKDRDKDPSIGGDGRKLPVRYE